MAIFYYLHLLCSPIWRIITPLRNGALICAVGGLVLIACGFISYYSLIAFGPALLRPSPDDYLHAPIRIDGNEVVYRLFHSEQGNVVWTPLMLPFDIEFTPLFWKLDCSQVVNLPVEQSIPAIFREIDKGTSAPFGRILGEIIDAHEKTFEPKLSAFVIDWFDAKLKTSKTADSKANGEIVRHAVYTFNELACYSVALERLPWSRKVEDIAFRLLPYDSTFRYPRRIATLLAKHDQAKLHRELLRLSKRAESEEQREDARLALTLY